MEVMPPAAAGAGRPASKPRRLGRFLRAKGHGRQACRRSIDRASSSRGRAASVQA